MTTTRRQFLRHLAAAPLLAAVAPRPGSAASLICKDEFHNASGAYPATVFRGYVTGGTRVVSESGGYFPFARAGILVNLGPQPIRANSVNYDVTIQPFESRLIAPSTGQLVVSAQNPTPIAYFYTTNTGRNLASMVFNTNVDQRSADNVYRGDWNVCSVGSDEADTVTAYGASFFAMLTPTGEVVTVAVNPWVAFQGGSFINVSPTKTWSYRIWGMPVYMPAGSSTYPFTVFDSDHFSHSAFQLVTQIYGRGRIQRVSAADSNDRRPSRPMPPGVFYNFDSAGVNSSAASVFPDLENSIPLLPGNTVPAFANFTGLSEPNEGVPIAGDDLLQYYADTSSLWMQWTYDIA